MPPRYWQGARQDVGFKEIESYLLEAYSVFEEIISIHKKGTICYNYYRILDGV